MTNFMAELCTRRTSLKATRTVVTDTQGKRTLEFRQAGETTTIDLPSEGTDEE